MRLPSLPDEPPEPPSETPQGQPYKYAARPTDDEIFPRWRPWLRGVWIGLGLLVVLMAAGYGLITQRKKDANTAVAQFSSVTQWTADPGLSITPAFSHDGKLVAYSSDREGAGNLAIWLRPYPSGVPRRLTKEEFHANDPDFSPDDTRIVYHSERDGGGIYIMPVSGAGQPRLLAKGGERPRFSPSGRWIAYYTATSTENDAAAIGVGGVYMITPEGGVPQRIRPDFPYARYPVWTPDGDHLLFEGVNAEGARDWWVTPIYFGEATRTHAFENLHAAVSVHYRPERWDRDRILFPAADGAYPHIWALAISPQSWQASGPPRQLTGGPGIEQSGAVGPDGGMLFSRMELVSDIWSLPLDGDGGGASGALQRVTDDHVQNQTPSLGAGATRMVYLSNRTGVRDVWVNDLKTGGERAITSFQEVGYRPVLSPDENRVAYRTRMNGQCAVAVQDLNRDKASNTLSGCFNIWDWSPDGSSLLIYYPARAVVSAELWKTDSGQLQPLLSGARFSLFDAGFSPDGKWIAFSAGVTLAEAEVFVAPFHGAVIKKGEWIPITRGGGSVSAWSPDAATVYFHSRRDGFHCIWAQKLNSAKRPTGDPYPIQHLHSVAFGLYMIQPGEFHMSATRNRLVFNLAKEKANLWVSAKSE
jgi:eukaryotic-like serine/threonine-protein kinase